MKNAILFLSSLGGGGAEGVCVTVANGLADLGWDVTVLTMNLNGNHYKSRLNESVKLVNLDCGHARYTLPALLRYLTKNELNYLIVFNYELIVLSTMARAILRKKFRLIARNINSISRIYGHDSIFRRVFIYPIIKQALLRVDLIVNQCEGMLEDIIRFEPRISDKCKVIYNPVSQKIEKYAAVEKKEGTEKYLLCIGRLEKQKSFQYAIEAFAELGDDYSEYRLKIVGQGSLENELKSLSKKLKVSHRVDFTGFQTGVEDYYKNAEVTLLTSIFEGFPNVLVESITLGTPVVAFDCQSGPSEIIVPGVNGELIEFQNKCQLIEGIKKVIDNKEAYKETASTSVRYRSNEITKEWEKVLLALNEN